MKRVLFCLLSITLITGTTMAQSWLKKEKEPEKSKGWLSNFEEAQKESKEFKQPIFAFFTGSDWCGWCIKLKKEVLDTKEFAKFAESNLILFEADFPRSKQLDQKTKQQNGELATKYGVRGYPTVYLLNAAGEQLGQTRYKAGGAEAYVKHLKEMFEKAGLTATDKANEKTLTPYEKMKQEKAKEADKATAAEKATEGK